MDPVELQSSFVAYEQAITEGKATSAELKAYGKLLITAGAHSRAVQVLDAALRSNPTDIEAWWALAASLRSMGEGRASVAAYGQAAAFKPQNAAFYLDYGKCLLEIGAAEAALRVARQGLGLDGGNLDLCCLLAAALLADGQAKAAAAEARQILARSDHNVSAVNTLGLALSATGDQKGALAAFAHAVAIRPDHRQSLANMALALWDDCQHEEALKAMLSVAERAADPRIHKLLSLLRISLGDFSRGWAGYHARHGARDVGGDPSPPDPPKGLPKWDGVVRPGERVLICGEQGIGDEVMFAGLIPRLLRRGGVFALTCESRLRELLLRSFPELPVLARGDYGSLPGDVTSWIWLGDLPGLLRPDLHGDAWSEPRYLRADAPRTEVFRRKYSDGRPLVGISWHTTNRRTGWKRSLPTPELRKLLSIDAVRWVSLQYGSASEMREIGGDRLVVDEEVDATADLDVFAAQVAAMDHVVTIDNSTVHFAGALGVPTLLLLPRCADWRWFVDRSDCPWYGSVDLIRQAEPGGWARVIERASATIRTW